MFPLRVLAGRPKNFVNRSAQPPQQYLIAMHWIRWFWKTPLEGPLRWFSDKAPRCYDGNHELHCEWLLDETEQRLWKGLCLIGLPGLLAALAWSRFEWWHSDRPLLIAPCGYSPKFNFYSFRSGLFRRRSLFIWKSEYLDGKQFQQNLCLWVVITQDSIDAKVASSNSLPKFT